MDKRASEGHLVDLRDGDDGGIVIEVHRKHRGERSLSLCLGSNIFNCWTHIELMVDGQHWVQSKRHRLWFSMKTV